MNKKLIEKKLNIIEKQFLSLLSETRKILANEPEEISYKKLSDKQDKFLKVLIVNKNNPLSLSELTLRLKASSNNLILHYFKMLHKRGFITYRSVKDYDINKIEIQNNTIL